MPTWLVYLLLAVNALTLLGFGWDKLLARTGKRRVREAHLLWLMALGGVLAGWVAMSLFRHKTSKAAFRWKALAASLVNGLWVWLWLRFG